MKKKMIAGFVKTSPSLCSTASCVISRRCKHQKAAVLASCRNCAKHMANSTPFPVRYRQLSAAIKDIQTDFILSGYDDHIMVMVTQIRTVGTMLYARKEEGFTVNPVFDVVVLFGKRDEPMLVACARELIEQISNAGCSRPLVLSLGLKDHSTEVLKEIIRVVIANKIW